jgi:hypothetical protein
MLTIRAAEHGSPLPTFAGCCWTDREQVATLGAMQESRQQPADIDDETVETAALTAAVALARDDRLGVPHGEMRAWLLRVADGDVTAPPPRPRPL